MKKRFDNVMDGLLIAGIVAIVGACVHFETQFAKLEAKVDMIIAHLGLADSKPSTPEKYADVHP